VAFHDDPLMRYLFGAAGAAYSDHLRALFRFSCAVRLLLDWPLLGSVKDGRLLGVLGVTEPEDKPWPSTLQSVYDQFKAVVGPAASRDLEGHAALTDAHRPKAPHHHLGVLGVHPEGRGKGHTRALLDAFHALADAHPASTGIATDTENPANVPMYEHFGYRVVAQEHIGPVHVWCLFRPRNG
jgi:ribosomal protein S18 acetylase RimI-like enzyme